MSVLLLRYIVSNFKSIGHPIEFSLLPTRAESGADAFQSIQTSAGSWKVLRRGGIFGPNASGKSSFIESIDYSRSFIVNGRKSGSGTGVRQFKGDFEDLDGKSTFQFVFYLDGEVYEYGFTLDGRQVYEEWLYQMLKTKFVPLFTRATDENGQTVVDFTPQFARKNSKEGKLAQILKDSLQANQKNQLYLHKLRENGIQKAEHIVSWFESIQPIFPGSKYWALPIQMKENEELGVFIGEMLKKLDTGISEAFAESEKIDFREYAERQNLPSEVIEQIEGTQTGIVNLEGKYFIFSHPENILLIS